MNDENSEEEKNGMEREARRESGELIFRLLGFHGYEL